jgi:hypothetical protein
LVKYEDPRYLPNPKFWVLLIQQFRHAIVHSGSRLGFAPLVDRLARDLNVRVEKQITLPPETLHKLQSFFKVVDGDAEIWLVDEHGIKTGTYHSTDRPFSQLIEELSSHACLVYDCVIKHFDQEPYWDRTVQQTDD